MCWETKLVNVIKSIPGFKVLEGTICKDAGFVYESLRNKTNQIFWDFWSYESNPRNGYLKKKFTKRIHDTNL